MNINNNGNRVHVTLSVRNLRDLVRAVERGDTAALRRTCEDGTTLTVEVESDEDHYRNGRIPGSGIDANKQNVGIGACAPHSKRRVQ